MFGIGPLIVIVVSVLFFKKAGEMGDGHRIGGSSGALPALASVGLWVLALFVLGWGFGFGLLLQAGLFAVMTLRNMARNTAVRTK